MSVTPTTMPPCPKCGGPLVSEHIGTEIDVVCLPCGWRKVGVWRVRLQRTAIAAVGPITTACAYCGKPFDQVQTTHLYCTRRCTAAARSLRRRNA